MFTNFRELDYENSIIELFTDMGYQHVYGPDIDRDYTSPLYDQILERQIGIINPDLPTAAIKEALNKLRHIPMGDLVSRNETFMDYLQNGIEVTFCEEGKNCSQIVYLIDYDNVGKNSFVIANQWKISENSNRRPDIIIFVNGLPLVVIELKSPSREETNASDGYLQLRNYMQDIPSLFVYNAFLVMSDLGISKAGTITSSEDRFMEWKSRDGERQQGQYTHFTTFFQGIFPPERLLDICRNYICFSHEARETQKILAGYHQYFAVQKALQSTKSATLSDGRGGVFWHTQGSGKSLSMVFYTHLLQNTLNHPTVVVMTDRNDLDNQLFAQFAKCQDFLRQTPEHAESRQHLHDLLTDRQANGIIFTTIQKFMESSEPLSQRRDVVVIADEAHRSQYGLSEKTATSVNDHGEKETKITTGIARLMRDSLPNATYIGFTGTPISAKDRDTREVFGDYIDIYDMTQAVKDGATKPVYYESRVIKLKLDEQTLRLIDQEYDLLSNSTEPDVIARSKRQLGQMESILGNPETLQSLVNDIIDHYENNRADLLTGKAMIVAYSRRIAMDIYHLLLRARPHWQNKLALVMTENNQDPEEWRPLIGNKAHRQELAVKFKDNTDPLKIVIVVDMWLTGFDVPSLSTMYVYKPMSGYNLMQAIARVNRVYKDKQGGLIVDYVGIATALKKAMNDYTVRDQQNYAENDISRTAYPKFMEKLAICQDIFHHFNYVAFFDSAPLARAQVISDAVDFLLAPSMSEKRELFLTESLALHQALSLCSSITAQKERLEAAFFETVRVTLNRLSNEGGDRKFSLRELNQRINELLKHSVQSEGVINLFSDVSQEFSIFDPEFLTQISHLKQKNLAVEMLKKLLNEQVRVFAHTNIVRAEKFSELIKQIMNEYLKGLITNEQVIQELLKVAQEISHGKQESAALGLTDEELAFYDVLAKPQAVKDFYSNDQLIAITKELALTLRENQLIDWDKKESTRAKIRMLIKKLLKKHNYPPQEAPETVDIVFKQCEIQQDA